MYSLLVLPLAAMGLPLSQTCINQSIGYVSIVLPIISYLQLPLANSMKKRSNKERQYQTLNRKVLCGRFAQRLNYNFAVGDEDNNLLVYNLHNDKPLTILNSQTSNVSSITSLIFSDNEDNVIVGSNRGSINVWDLNTLKISYYLKGHAVEITSFAVDSNSDNVLASGSYDTNVKIWDTRLKNCLHILKAHQRQVCSLAISPDSRYVLSGSEDTTAQCYDLRMFRPVFEYAVGANVLSLAFHKHSMVFAAGCSDRMARIYQLASPFSLTAATRNESMPVVSTYFYGKNFLFTAASESLKVWDIKKGCIMTDNIQNSAKGPLDLVVTQTQSQEIGFSSGALCLHTCQLSAVNFKGEYTHVYTPPARDQDTYNNIINRNEQIPTKRQDSIKKSIVDQLTANGVKSAIQRRSESIAKTLVNVKQDVNTAMTNVMRLTDQISKNRSEVAELTGMMDEHNKFLNILAVRARTIEKVMDLWALGNTKAIISMLKDAEIYVVADVLTHILKPSKFPISVDFAIVIVENSKEMMLAKHMTLIKHGLSFLSQVLGLFKDDIIKIKLYPADNRGVDLAREERLRKYDRLIELFVEVYQNPRLKKLLGKKQELCRAAELLSNELAGLLKKLSSNQDNF